jgi:hypothetical protein
MISLSHRRAEAHGKLEMASQALTPIISRERRAEMPHHTNLRTGASREIDHTSRQDRSLDYRKEHEKIDISSCRRRYQ